MAVTVEFYTNFVKIFIKNSMMKRFYAFALTALIMVSNQLVAQKKTSTGLSGVIVPQYFVSGLSSQRNVNYMRLRVQNLMPNSSYKYVVRAIRAKDIDTNLLMVGAANQMFIDDKGRHRYTTNASLTSPGGHDTLNTNMMGEYEGWFGLVGTGNATYTDTGKYTYLAFTAIGMNNNDTIRYYCADSMKVIYYGSTSNPNQGTGIYGKCYGDTLNFVALYDNVNGSGRPLTLTSIQTPGMYTGANLSSLATFYNTNVYKKTGLWGGIIPNDLSTGVLAISHLSVSTGFSIYTHSDSDGIWGPNKINTINPRGGSATTTALFLSENDAPLIQPVIEFSTRSSTTNEGNGVHRIFVSRKYSNSTSSKVRLTVSGGSAIAGTDFTSTLPKDIVFNAASFDGLDTTEITLVDDNISEGTENIFFKLDQVSNAKLGVETSHSVSISDNDVANISITKKQINVDEADGKVGIEIKMDRAVTNPTKLRLFVKDQGDSTSIPTEFSLGVGYKDSTFDFGKSTGPDSIVIFANVYEDIFSDKDDSITLVLRKISGEGFIQDSTTLVVIEDNDGPSTIQMLGNVVTVNENVGSVDVKIRVIRKKAAGGDFALRLLTAESTAKESLDFKFNPVSQIKSISSSSPDTLVYSIPIVNDETFEITESLKFGLINVSNILISKPDTFRIIIKDNDLPIYNIGTVNKQTKSDGTPDSSGVFCRVFGVVYGVNTRSAGLGFTLRDGTGGLGIFSPTNTYGYSVKEGDSVMVQGRISHFQGTAQMDFLDTIIWISSNSKLKNAKVISKVDASTESDLCQLRRVILVDETEWPVDALNANGFRYVRVIGTNGQIDTLNIDAETDIDGKPAPVGYFNVMGLGVQYDNKAPYFEKYYLAPRSISDFSVANLPVIKFSKKTDEVTELADSFKMELLISPTDENFSVDVVQIGGTAISPQDYDYTTKTINVIKNNNYYSIKANITDDLVGDEDKTLIFALRNLQGPGSIGSDSVITLTIKDNEPSSVKNISETNMRLYPNPSTGLITVSNVRNVIHVIEISDVSGRVVKIIDLDSYDFSSDAAIIDLTNYTGIHFIKFTSYNGQIYNSKVIIK